ncbi:MAG: rhodanese-like domain-containing protein [Acidilobaceae archaeon]
MEGYKEIWEAEEVAKLMSEGALVIDVRAEQAYQKEHIPGAINIPLAKIEEAMKDIPKDKTIVVYCGSVECTASYMAARKLAASGYENVYRYTPGIKGWKESGFKIEYGVFQ